MKNHGKPLDRQASTIISHGDTMNKAGMRTTYGY